MARLALLFIVVPVLELVLLIEIGRRLGTVGTLALILLTGLLGAFLTRLQGLAVLRQVQAEVAAGRLPASPLLDGLFVLLAGALLITPGVLTDACGLFCLLPAGRAVLKARLRKWLEDAIRTGRVRVSFHLGFGPRPGTTMRNVTPRQPSADLSAEPDALPGTPESPDDRGES